MKTIIGLGNPGEKYEGTRHNTGRMAAEYFAAHGSQSPGGTFGAFEFAKQANTLVAHNRKTIIALPETFMNKSGQSAAKLVRVKKELKDLIVIHDDLDLPLGRFKITYGRGSGGHKGVESIMRALKTKNFWRIRIGVIPGKKKPPDIMKFIISKFKPAEEKKLKKIFKEISTALTVMLEESHERAMSEYN